MEGQVKPNIPARLRNFDIINSWRRWQLVMLIRHLTFGRFLDVLRQYGLNNIENLTRKSIFWQGQKVVILSFRGERDDW